MGEIEEEEDNPIGPITDKELKDKEILPKNYKNENERRERKRKCEEKYKG